jgi:ADP-heptose:LPS heptosyltransferase
VRDWGPIKGGVRRIIILKLDHYGDFVISLPALRDLRATFRNAWIRMVCGSWNRANAEASGLVDEVRTFDYFPENAMAWDGHPVQDLRAFAQAVQGEFDLAVDFRVDEDTRHLLRHIVARLRCGIGSKLRFRFLDVALPATRSMPPDRGRQFLLVDRFVSRMESQTQSSHKTHWPAKARYVVYGPYLHLPPGRFMVIFWLSLVGVLPGLRGFSVSIDVCRDRYHTIAQKTFRRPWLARLEREARLEFDNPDEASVYEFRVQMAGRPLTGRLHFAGVLLDNITGGLYSDARFKPAELHVGELLALLVTLIKQRAIDVYATERDALPSSLSRLGELERLPDGSKRIVIAPTSNSTVRDWPARSYAALINMLLDRTDCCVILVGSAQQAEAIRAIRDEIADPKRVVDLAGRTSWKELGHLLAGANLVICNNSGVAHQAARFGVATVAIYSGSHQPQEWGPRGRRSRALMALVPCSPCGLEHVEDCPREHLCMKLITPELVLQNALDMMGDEALPGCTPGDG